MIHKAGLNAKRGNLEEMPRLPRENILNNPELRLSLVSGKIVLDNP